MTRILHLRGDMAGMFLFFLLFFVGLIQITIAWKRLNGLSLTGYPDRRALSFIIGVIIAAGSCAWYFSRPRHFAYPDVEGIETLMLLVLGLFAALLVQAGASAFNLWRRVSYGEYAPAQALDSRQLSITVDNSEVPAVFRPATDDAPTGKSVLLLHDYGGDTESVSGLAASVSRRGHHVLSLDLDGHGANTRDIADPLMEKLLTAALRTLKGETGRDKVSVLGIGFGGTLAIELARRDSSVERAIAVDPPAIESAGYPAVNALRELGPTELIRALHRPGARGAAGKRVSLSRLLQSLPQPQPHPDGRLTVFGTEGIWFNAPEDLGEYLRVLRLSGPMLLEGNHTSIAFQMRTLDEIDEALKGSAGPTARPA